MHPKTYGSSLLLFLLLTVFSLTDTHSQNSDLPLFQMSDMQYAGAFRLPAQQFGTSDLNFAEGPIAYNPDSNTIYLVGHAHQQAIGEFSIPTLSMSEELKDLNMATNRQPFVQHLNQTGDGNPEQLDRIGGMIYYDGQLIVNAYEYYDAPANNTLTTMLVADALDLETSPVDGFYSLQGGAGHTSGWISPIPAEWRAELDGTHITGQSSGIPIIGRSSVGPSAFAFNATDIVSGLQNISTTKLLDFSLQNPLHTDLENKDGANDIWTHLSRVTFGMIVPATRTYLTIGYSGGHNSGVCYKCTQNNGNTCGGYCPPDTADRSQYYWLWDMNDLMAVKNGLKQAHDVRPYDYGVLNTPFENATQQIGGGTYDEKNNILYLSILKADREQGTYANPPVIVGYQLNKATATARIADFFPVQVQVYPNPFKDEIKIEMESEKTEEIRAFIYDMMGRKIAYVFDGTLRAHDPRHIYWKPMKESSAIYQLVIETGNTHKVFQLVYQAE